MSNLLTKMFIKNSEQTDNPKVRTAYGMLGSIFGIVCNLILSVIKIVVGTIFFSISILADGLNNLADMGSSIINLIGFKLSSRPADNDHPFGHARFEYIAGLIIAFLIVVIGFEVLTSSIDKIMNVTKSEINNLIFYILGGSILVKLYMSFFYIKISKKINSLSMKAASIDSFNDAITTFIILLSMIFIKFTAIEVDGYVGVLISVYIMISGIKLVKETLNPILGEKPSFELVETVKNKILGYKGVLGIHDLLVHNYGVNQNYATVHVEVCSEVPILESHELIDLIEQDFVSDNIHLCIHLDPIVTNDENVNTFKEMVQEIVKNIDESLAIHDFRIVVGQKRNNLIFDLVIPYESKLIEKEILEQINNEVIKKDKKCRTVIKVDRNYTL